MELVLYNCIPQKSAPWAEAERSVPLRESSLRQIFSIVTKISSRLGRYFGNVSEFSQNVHVHWILETWKTNPFSRVYYRYGNEMHVSFWRQVEGKWAGSLEQDAGMIMRVQLVVWVQWIPQEKDTQCFRIVWKQEWGVENPASKCVARVENSA